MKILSTAWITGSFADFEASCCLMTHAALGLATESVPFDIYILYGYEKLPQDFKLALASRHIRLHDIVALSGRYRERYAGLFALLGPEQGSLYEVYCFLRWLVLEEALGGEAFLHVDLDLFFQMPFDQVAAEFQGLSGTFGSPCLTAVGTPDWLAVYHDALDDMIADRTAFQEKINYKGNEFRPDISSDQDLVQALELAGALPRRKLAALSERYQIFINPIWPYQVKPTVARLHEIKDGVDVIGGKPVLFWHLQNNFADYISRFAIVSDFDQTWLRTYLPVKLGLPFIQLAPTAENFAFQALRELAWDRIRGTIARSGDIHELGREKYFSRTWVSEWFILQKKGRGLFSGDFWWEDGVFSSKAGSERHVDNRAALEILQRVAGSVPIHDRDHILQIIAEYNLTGPAVEVGTFNGTFANEILTRTSVTKLTCVDPYIAYDDFKDSINGMDMAAIFAQAQRFLNGHGDRVAFARDFSEAASCSFADNSLDFVYIDGNHQSAYVAADLKAWWPKVRKGGLVIGNDCVDLDDGARNAAGDVTFVHRRGQDGTPDLYGDYGVLHALRHFCVEMNVGYIKLGSQFVIPK